MFTTNKFFKNQTIGIVRNQPKKRSFRMFRKPVISSIIKVIGLTAKSRFVPIKRVQHTIKKAKVRTKFLDFISRIKRNKGI